METSKICRKNLLRGRASPAAPSASWRAAAPPRRVSAPSPPGPPGAAAAPRWLPPPGERLNKKGGWKTNREKWWKMEKKHGKNHGLMVLDLFESKTLRVLEVCLIRLVAMFYWCTIWTRVIPLSIPRGCIWIALVSSDFMVHNSSGWKSTILYHHPESPSIKPSFIHLQIIKCIWLVVLRHPSENDGVSQLGCSEIPNMMGKS